VLDILFAVGMEAQKIMADKLEIKLEIRWLILRDMPEVLEIERSCFEYAVWTEEDFLCCLRQISCIGMVAEHDHNIVGFMVYELHKMKLRIINFAVDPTEQRRGIGGQMIRRLVEKLIQQRRKKIVLEVNENNLSAQMFYKSQGFLAKHVLNDFYVIEDGFENAYFMEYNISNENSNIPIELNERNLRW